MMLGSSAVPPEGQTLAEDPLHEKNPPRKVLSSLHDSMIGKFVFWIYLVSDTLLRCGAYALGFSEVVRPIGIPLAIIFALCQVALSFWETTCVILDLVGRGLRALLDAICWLLGLACRILADLPAVLAYCLSEGPHPPWPEASDGPQDWDVECAEACLPCLPCFIRLVKIFWCICVRSLSRCPLVSCILSPSGLGHDLLDLDQRVLCYCCDCSSGGRDTQQGSSPQGRLGCSSTCRSAPS